MFQQIFEIVAPLFLIVAIGYVYGKTAKPEMSITNRLVMDVFVPALIFHVMIQEGFNVIDYLPLVIAASILMLISGVIAFVLARTAGFSWRSFVPPAMFSNWANLGLPLYVLTLGTIALDGGVMLVIIGNVLCFTLGAYIYSGQLNGFDVLKTPIIIVVVLGLVISGLSIQVPTVIDLPIKMLGDVAIPMMLFSLGVRLSYVGLTHAKLGIIMSVFCPVVGVSLALILVTVIPMTELHQQILIIFGALPPAVVNFMLAEQYNAEPDKVASMVMIANVMSLISIPIVLFFLLL